MLACATGAVTVMHTHHLRPTMVASAVVFVGCVGLPVWVKAHRLARFLASGMREIDAMTGVDFEHYVAATLRKAGYRVALTKATGDFGVDLIAAKGKERIAIQCKRRGRPIGAAAVQQVVAGALMHRCASTMVVSNQEFTPAAIQLAEVHSCQLIGRTRLRQGARAIRVWRR